MQLISSVRQCGVKVTVWYIGCISSSDTEGGETMKSQYFGVCCTGLDEAHSGLFRPGERAEKASSPSLLIFIVVASAILYLSGWHSLLRMWKENLARLWAVGGDGNVWRGP